MRNLKLTVRKPKPRVKRGSVKGAKVKPVKHDLYRVVHGVRAGT